MTEEYFKRFVDHFDRRLTDHDKVLVLETNHANMERWVGAIDRRVWWILTTSIITMLGVLSLLLKH